MHFPKIKKEKKSKKDDATFGFFSSRIKVFNNRFLPFIISRSLLLFFSFVCNSLSFISARLFLLPCLFIILRVSSFLFVPGCLGFFCPGTLPYQYLFCTAISFPFCCRALLLSVSFLLIRYSL